MKTSNDRFLGYRQNIIGNDLKIDSRNGKVSFVYADWAATGRAYRVIEERIQNDVLPKIANTHSESSGSGLFMTKMYDESRHIIKQHVNADEKDNLFFCGYGMTESVNKLQRMLGLRIPDPAKQLLHIKDDIKPVVFISHMEHHSNHISWYETIADVEIIHPTTNDTISMAHLHNLLKHYKKRHIKIAAITACSNVTGIITDYHEIAQLMHHFGGYCFVDFSASAPYVHIDMHPQVEDKHLDAIYYSTHKFLGGPGAAGILIINEHLHSSMVPDNPGGGSILWSNPCGKYRYYKKIEVREDSGSPGTLQAIKAAMCHKLKEEMGIDEMLTREKELTELLLSLLTNINGLRILSEKNHNRIGIVSIIIIGLHYDLGVRILNDFFGIQVRGGCCCAGTYGHYLLQIGKHHSKLFTYAIDNGSLLDKPGWIRISIHPTMSCDEIMYIANSINQVITKKSEFTQHYRINKDNSAFIYNGKYNMADTSIIRNIYNRGYY